MFNSPSHSEAGPVLSLLFTVLGGYLAAMGVKVVIRRETKLGPKGGPYKMVYGREAISVGIYFTLVGLFFLGFGVLGFLKGMNWI